MPHLQPQELLANRYIVIELVGTGGFAEVYSAFDTLWRRQVALKVLKEEELQLQEAMDEFLAEAQSQARLCDHPAVVTIYDSGATVRNREPFPFCAMEWLPGGSLETRLRRAREARVRLDPRQVLRWGAEVAGALARAAELGILHRDVKPGNILLDAEEHAHLGDFGLARDLHTRGGMNSVRGAGTLQFMAPEQFRPKGQITPKVDVFALGSTLWYLLLDEVPFPAGSAVLLAADQQPPRLRDLWPEAPPDLEELFGRMLSGDPDVRPAASQVREVLLSLLRTLERPRWSSPEEDTPLPPGAVLGLGSPRAIFGAAVTQVVFVEGTRRALSGGEDLQARLWDLDTGAELVTLEGRGAPISALTTFADGSRALTGAWDGSIRLWDLERGAELHCFYGHHAAVSVVAAAPDGSHAVSIADDGTLRVWDVESHRELNRMDIPHSRSQVLFADQQGWKAVFGGLDGRVRVWNLHTGREQQCLEGHAGPVTTLYATPGSLLSASTDGTLRVWDLTSGQESSRLTRAPGHEGNTYCLFPDGRHAVSTGTDCNLRLWDLSRGIEVNCVRNPFGPQSMALSADGRWVLTGNRNGCLTLYPYGALLDTRTR